MLFRSKKTRKPSPQRDDVRSKPLGRRLCRLEPLESRRLLAAFDLPSYELYLDTTLNIQDSTAEEFSGAAYSDVTDSIYLVDDEVDDNTKLSWLVEYKPDKTLIREIQMKNFIDPEGIVYMGSNRFAIIDEGDYETEGEFDHSFHITIVNIPPGTSETLIDKDLVTQDLPHTGVMVVVHADLTRGSNNGPESIAYDPINATDGYFYFLKETNRIHAFRVKVDDSVSGAVEADVVNIPGLSGEETPDVLNISDVFFTEIAGSAGNTKRLMLLSANSEKVISADVDDSNENNLSAAIIDDAQSNPVEIDLTEPKFEGLTFTPDGFLMFVVSDRTGGFAVRRFRQYRNFNSLTPAAAPDLDEASDTRVNDDNVTTDQTPTFSGTLTRGIFEDSVPVEDAWVWLYVDGVQTGSADQVGTGEFAGEYTLTGADADIDPGSGQSFTIKAGPSSTTPEAERSFASAGLLVTIALTDSIADLNIDGFVDFQDLTVLLANWGQTDPFPSAAEGNLVDAQNTSVDFGDLTVLLAFWTGPGGPGGAGSPEATTVWPDEGDTAYSASIDVYVVFSEEVQGVDASDLELFGLGGIEATVGTPTNIFNDIWKFPVSGLLPRAVRAVLAIDEDDITDMAGNSIEPKYWQFIVDPGLWLNEDGTGDVALSADFLGLSSTEVTVEVTFVSDEITSGIGAGTPIFAYATDDEPNAFTLFIENDSPNNMKLLVNGASRTLASGTDVTDLFDGVKYHLAVTYDSDTGKARAYVDGTAIGTEQTFSSPTTVDDGSDNKGGTFFLGQEPDNETAPGFGFDTEQIFQGSILEVRIYDEVRTPLSRSNPALFSLSA